ncbi:tripartite motif-containing protein 59-like [Anneissia japonica]|uniref:tripartite motif-containing protein 59-like n=1 Tax=Anneissia japonica TaxID=1529436 RepID=UPI00142552C7|nr:tripartite motif-containing protein 59-like [Anneissia japonica]
MAYSVLEQLKEDALKCELCFEVPGDDDTKNVFKQLRCNHTFCKNCLVKLVKPEGRITCPNCRDETVLDNAVSVDSLPLAFQVTNVIDWINKKQVKELKCQTSDRQCPEHKVQTNFFCIDCNEYVCGDCLALTHDKKHTSLYIKTEAESMRKGIQKMIKEIDFHLVHWKKAENQKNQIAVRINADAANAKASLQKCTGQVIKTLEEKKKWLMNSIINEHTAKLNTVRTENVAITHQMKEYETKVETVRRSLEHSDDHEVFKARVAIGKIHKEVLDKLPPILPDQSQACSLRFTPNLLAVKRLQTDIKRIGKVHTMNTSIVPESLIHVRNMTRKDISPAVLKHMESAVKEAFELEVQKLPLSEDRMAKCKFIVNRLQSLFGEKWSCMIGDFGAKLNTVHYAVFIVNEADLVFVFKNKLNTTDEENRNTVQEDKPKLKHQTASSSYNKETDNMTKIKTPSRSLACTSVLSCGSPLGPRSTGVPKLVIKRTHRDMMSEQYPRRLSIKESQIPVTKKRAY